MIATTIEGQLHKKSTDCHAAQRYYFKIQKKTAFRLGILGYI
jgi:hypothetical protein